MKMLLKVFMVMMMGVMVMGASVMAETRNDEVVGREVADNTGSGMGSGTSGGSGSGGGCSSTLMGLRAWYADLPMDGDCVIQSPSGDGEEIAKFVWTIVLNILTDIFIIAGYASVGFVIYGGYLYLMSAGDAQKVARGKKTLTNAVIGLIISLLAAVITNFIITMLGAAVK